MRPEPRVDRPVGRRRQILGELDGAPAADAAAEGAQAVGRGRAVPGEPTAGATRRGLAELVQRFLNVPSVMFSAFVIFWAAGSDDDGVVPGAWA
jgi:hypothetical protein